MWTRLSNAAAALLCALAFAAPARGQDVDDSRSRVIQSRAFYPEGPLWQDGALYVAELRRDRVNVFRGPSLARETYWRRRGCGPTALAPYGGGFLVLCHVEGKVIAIDAQKRTRFIRDRTIEGHVFRDPNDASADDAGGVYFSDPGPFYRDMVGSGAVIYLDAQGDAHVMADGLWYPNGVLFDSTRRVLYVSETFSHRVLRYAVAADHTLTPIDAIDFSQVAPPPRAQLPDYDQWGPDGLEFGPNGEIFAALYGQGRYVAFTPELRYLGAIEVAPQFSTNLAFGPHGEAYTTGSFSNTVEPFLGEVRRWEHFAQRLVPPPPAP